MFEYIQTQLSIAYAAVLLCLSLSSTISAIMLLYKSTIEHYSISNLSLSLSNLIFIHTILAFFSSLLTLFNLLHSIIKHLTAMLCGRRNNSGVFI